eukprot:3313919-Rhodomonas_salina.1
MALAMRPQALSLKHRVLQPQASLRLLPLSGLCSEASGWQVLLPGRPRTRRHWHSVTGSILRLNSTEPRTPSQYTCTTTKAHESPAQAALGAARVGNQYPGRTLALAGTNAEFKLLLRALCTVERCREEYPGPGCSYEAANRVHLSHRRLVCRVHLRRTGTRGLVYHDLNLRPPVPRLVPYLDGQLRQPEPQAEPRSTRAGYRDRRRPQRSRSHFRVRVFSVQFLSPPAASTATAPLPRQRRTTKCVPRINLARNLNIVTAAGGIPLSVSRGRLAISQRLRLAATLASPLVSHFLEANSRMTRERLKSQAAAGHGTRVPGQ